MDAGGWRVANAFSSSWAEWRGQAGGQLWQELLLKPLTACSPASSCLVPAPLQLTALGFLLGFAYVRSRNLLTPMLIHGAWNGSVLTILFLLASQVGGTGLLSC